MKILSNSEYAALQKCIADKEAEIERLRSELDKRTPARSKDGKFASKNPDTVKDGYAGLVTIYVNGKKQTSYMSSGSYTGMDVLNMLSEELTFVKDGFRSLKINAKNI